MNKKVLSKKVMISLLTISCVYLGGTSVLPMAEAAIVDGQDVADGTTLNFTDNHTINQNMDKQPAITIDQNKNVTINAQGTLNILGSRCGCIHKSSSSIRSAGSHGKPD